MGARLKRIMSGWLATFEVQRQSLVRRVSCFLTVYVNCSIDCDRTFLLLGAFLICLAFIGSGAFVIVANKALVRDHHRVHSQNNRTNGTCRAGEWFGLIK